MNMRDLRGDDLFILLAIIGKLDIKDEFITLFAGDATIELDFPTIVSDDPIIIAENKAQRDKAIEKRGMTIMANVLQTVMINISRAKAELNELLAALCGVDPQVIKELGLKEYTALIVAFFKKPELKDFFSSIALLME